MRTLYYSVAIFFALFFALKAHASDYLEINGERIERNSAASQAISVFTQVTPEEVSVGPLLAESFTFRIGVIGTFSAGSRRRTNVILMFKLPDVADSSEITSASASVTIGSKQDSPNFNIDLWGLGYLRASETAPDGDQDHWRLFGDADTLPGVGINSRTKIQDNWIAPGSTIPITAKTSTTGNSNLIAFIKSLYDAGAEGGDLAILRLNPDEFLIPQSGGTPGYTVHFDAVTQTCVAPTADIVAWYTGDSDASDLWGQNNGVLINGATAGAAGHVDQAFSFDGVDNHVVVADSPSLDFRDAFSIEAWVNPISLTHPSQVGAIASKWAVPSNDRSFVFGVFQTGQLFFMVSSNQVDEFVLSSSTIPIGSFSHVGVVFDSGEVRFYINGNEELTSVPITTIDQTNNPLSIGVRKQTNGDSMVFHGLIDEPRLYDRALMASEFVGIASADTVGVCKDETPSELEEEQSVLKFRQHPDVADAAQGVLVGSVEMTGGGDIVFSMELSCSSAHAVRSCTVIPNSTTKDVFNDAEARLVCQYDPTSGSASARLRLKDPVPHGDQCYARALATEGVFRLLDARFTGTQAQ